MTIQIAQRIGRALGVRSATRIKELDSSLREYVRSVPQAATTPITGSFDASQVGSGTFADARIAQSNVTQHEAALSIDWLQLDSVPASFTPSAHTHAETDIIDGTILARLAANETVTGTWDFSTTIRAPTGVGSAPGHTFTGDTDTGLGQNGADTLSAIAGAIEMIRATATSSTNRHIILQHVVRFGTVISPTALAANTDDWAPTGHETCSSIRMDASGPFNLTGIVAAALIGRLLFLHNISASTMTLVHDATSTAANRFLCPGAANYALRAHSTVLLWYDVTSSRWRLASGY